MPQTDWRLKGEWVKNCNCAYGCPCDFNARPTNGSCKGLVAMHITEGHFGGVNLDGLKFAATVDFPGPLHEGNGTMQPIVDERATPEQRDALFQIMSGKHSAEGTLFHIFSLIVTSILDPVFAPIEFGFDMRRDCVARISGTDALTPTPVRAHATRTDSGRPSSSIRFRARAAMATSVARPGSVRERNASPITRF